MEYRLGYFLDVSHRKNQIQLDVNINNKYEHLPYYYDNIRDITKISTTRIGTRFATNLIPRLRASAYWSIHYRQASNKVNDQSNRILTNRLTVDMTCTPMLKYTSLQRYHIPINIRTTKPIIKLIKKIS